MNTTSCATAILAALTLCACGGGTSPDGGNSDGGSPEPDGGSCVEGETRSVACGTCAQRIEQCVGAAWDSTAECVEVGACRPGDVETEEGPMCGTSRRACTDACEWGDWDAVTPPGECIPGERETVSADTCGLGGELVRTCDSSCAWEEAVCVDRCGGSARTSPADAEEVCVPAGGFMRGDEDIWNARPVAEVYISAFYVDRYPVTNRRYALCVAAGQCEVPEATDGAASLADPARERFPVQGVSYEQARLFCVWDGSRRLLTEAEWEKAARGPAPSEQLYTWGDEFRCDLVDCDGGWPTLLQDEVDARPMLRSPYGLDLMVGGGSERTSDLHAHDYYSRPESLRDPRGASGGWRVCRGRPRGFGSEGAFRLAVRQQCDRSGVNPLAVFRCARRAEEDE